MNNSVGRIETDPLFMALTRPTMLIGVTFLWIGLEGMISMMVFINTSSFKSMFIVIIPMHLVGYLACSNEPRFVELFIIWGKFFPKCVNRGFHGNTSSYDPY